MGDYNNITYVEQAYVTRYDLLVMNTDVMHLIFPDNEFMYIPMDTQRVRRW